MTPMTPQEARTFAQALLQAADDADAAGAAQIDITSALSQMAGSALDALEAALAQHGRP